MAGWGKKREVMRNYNRLAAAYDVLYAEEQNKKMKTALSHVHIKEGSFMLDLGCGTGLLFEHVKSRAKLLVGLDTSTRILRESKKRARQFPNTAIIRADADFTPFPDETFDIVYAITLLQNMPNPLSTLYETKRVSKRRSIIVVTGLKKGFSQDAFTRLLKRAELKISNMKTNDQLKEYIVVCRKS